MNTHTPGPWSVEDKFVRDEDDGAFTIYVGRHGDGYVLCGRSGFPSRAEESRANARLIAAAPDLLEALKDLLAWVPGQADLGSPYRHLCNQARAAITKAEGAAK